MTAEQLIDTLRHGDPTPLQTMEGARALGALLQTLFDRVAQAEQQSKLDRAAVQRVKSGTL